MNPYIKSIAAVWIVVLIPGCATALSMERRDYILAHPHGWVELSIEDNEIPRVPVDQDESRKLGKPMSCYVRIDVNAEPYLAENVYPFGEEEPFIVSSGLRFPVPAGTVQLQVSYSGCELQNGEESRSVANSIVDIKAGMVVDMRFDGDSLSTGVSSPDETISLEDIYEAITGRRSVK